MKAVDPAKIKPIGDSVLVRCDSLGKEQVSSGGIIIPESTGHTEHVIGEVIAVGPGKTHFDGPNKGKFIKTYLKPGDMILFSIEGAEPVETSDEDSHYELIKSEISVLGTL
jgi:co-chaperonin GroES (HSP10)